MASNAALENRWVDAWNDLLDLAKNRPGIMCQLPDGTIVDVEECKGWLQEAVYQGYMVQLESGTIAQHPGVLVTRF